MPIVQIDTTGLETLARDLQLGYVEAAEDAKKVLKRSAQNIKTGWRKAWADLAHAPSLPNAVTYDVKVSKYTVEADIGPDKNRRQGALGNLVEYGSVKNAPRPGGGPATTAEEPRLEAAMNAIRPIL